MSFRPRNNNYLGRNNSNKNILLTISAGLFLIIILLLPWSKNILFKVGTPLWTTKNTATSFFSDNFSVLNSKKALVEENIQLKEKINLNEMNSSLFALIKKENQDLKNILGRSNTNQKLLLAVVLVKPFLSPYDTIIIDVGSSDGVVLGDKVIVDGNVFAGYVSEVNEKNSKVVLYSSPGEKVNVLIGSNNIEKEAIGLGGGNFKVSMPRESDIKEGDFITIPSVSTNIFGVVEKVDFKESDSFQNVLFKNPINIAELKWVEVLLSNKK